MTKVTREKHATPEAGSCDSEVLQFRAQFEQRSPLDELVRQGAQRVLQAAIDDEVNAFIAAHDDRRDEAGNRIVVRNGYLPAREIVTGAGKLEVQQPRVRDNSADVSTRVRFSSAILPPYLRRSKSVEEFIPWLYLRGISTGDFSEVLQTLLGEEASGLSPNVVVRLKEQWSAEYEEWSRRDLSQQQYVYVWADGIYANVRLEDPENKRQCLLILMGARADGHKGIDRGRRWLSRE